MKRNSGGEDKKRWLSEKGNLFFRLTFKGQDEEEDGGDDDEDKEKGRNKR